MKNQTRWYLLWISLILLLASCGSEAEVIIVTVEVEKEVTRVVVESVEVEVVKEVEVEVVQEVEVEVVQEVEVEVVKEVEVIIQPDGTARSDERLGAQSSEDVAENTPNAPRAKKHSATIEQVANAAKPVSIADTRSGNVIITPTSASTPIASAPIADPTATTVMIVPTASPPQIPEAFTSALETLQQVEIILQGVTRVLSLDF